MKMSLAEADAVPLAFEMASAQMIRKPGTGFVATVDPRNLAHGLLERADVFVLHLILDNPDRPVYLSSTSGNYGRQLGINDYLLTQGLARKVMTSVPVATKDTVNLPSEGWIDVNRSLALWRAFEAPKTLISRGDWVDKPSVNIPALYVMSGYFLAEALATTGDRADADSVMHTAAAIARAASLDDVFRPPTSVPALPMPETGDVPRTTRVPAVPAPSSSPPAASTPHP
jgi:hypothetical protein